MSKQIVILLTTLFSLFGFGCTTATSGQEKEKSDTAKVAQDTSSNSIFFVDVRSPQEFASGSVNGAVNIPLDQVDSRISEFKEKKEIVVFCRSGNRSSQAKSILESNGITNVTNGGSWEDVKAKYNR